MNEVLPTIYHPLTERLAYVRPHREAVAGLLEEIKCIGNYLGWEVPPTSVPEYVLAKPLAADEKTELNAVLEQPYAAYFVTLQDEARPIHIVESGERMVNLARILAQRGRTIRLSQLPINQYGGEWAGKPRIYWVREQVAECMDKVAAVSNHLGLVVQIEDGFRPLGVQEGLFQHVIGIVAAANPTLDSDALIERTRSMIAVAPWLAGHKSGAAIDFTLYTREGKMLDLGHPYLALGPEVAIDYPYLTWEQYRTRMLFRTIAEASGLIVYPGEDWHVSVGDVFSTSLSGGDTAVYGPIKGFDPVRGFVEPYRPEDYYVPFSFTLGTS